MSMVDAEKFKEGIKEHFKKTLLLICSGGCHTCQLLKLQEQLGDKYDYEYVICRGYKMMEKDIKMPGKRFYITEPRGKKDSKIMAVFKSLRCALGSIAILRKSRADAIITAGPGVAAIFCFVAKKVLRKKTKIFYIDDACRVSTKSMTGRLMERFNLADLFLVQWSEMQNKYKNAIYAGRIL